ncbi:transglutaminase-like domain-containing protein [Oceanobacter mangrovi]|uniref:transglutaminase-like domain-containing protein n=1 Tax=Oceanobacter mangrovi TaxID=2862510 RepID=UPI001FE9FC83|nr:transglutaminase-like domain-containing protein [Oceanobacter mangrovi]
MRWDQENRNLHQVLGNLKNHVKQQRQQVLDEVNAERGFISRAMNAIGLGQDALADDDGKRYLQRLNSLKSDVELSLDTELEQLKAKGVDDVIIQRQLQQRQKILDRYQQVQNQLQAATQEQSLQEQQENIDELQQTLEQYQTRKPRDPFDPNKLPWRIPNPQDTPAPADDANQLSQRYQLPLFEQGPMLATNVITADMLGNPGGPTQADLDATLDAQITETIQAKAVALNNDPVEIYQWVRNNIEFIPSYGSIQGAEYTLQHGKGNAFDTASLLVALLRAANIPARYAFGTVRIPADKVMNWVGNVQAAESAGHLMGQGGIPNTAQTIGGKIAYYKLEHVWVEAWIDYLPSRGAKHSTGDTWIPMDASFKQYEYTEGMNLEEQVPFDAQALADTIEQNTTINEDEGWIQNVPQSDVEQALTDYQAQLQQYIENQNPDATVGDVLGTTNIKSVVRESLAASLPYELMTRKLVASSLTDSQRWKFQYTLGTSLYGQMGSTLLSINKPTVELAGKKLALSFAPATDADAETIASYLPEPDENGEIDPNAIPDTLPGYLINLVGEFSIGNEVVATSSAVSMGSELLSEMGYWSPSWGLETTENEPVAGEYRAIALDLQGISQTQAAALKTDLETTQAKLTAEDYTDLGKQQLVGDLLYSTILSYFALNNLQDELTARAASMVSFKAPSYGMFKTNLKPQYWFGVPRNVVIDGLTMDVDHIEHQVVERNNDQERWKAYNRANGARMSAMEHMVPELMLSTEDNPAHGISAVKAIQLAASEGQKIWTITQANLSTALAAIDLPDDIETDIQNSVYAGKEVTAHETAVNFYGTSQVGYIVLDPETGAGGYLIGGGENGGEIIENSISQRLGWSQYTENSSVTGSLVNGVVNYVGFSLNYVASWVKCSETVLNIISFIVIIILAALIVSALSLGSGAGVAIGLLLWASSSYAAKPTGGEDCKMDCSLASAFQLKAAGIEDGHAYKTSYGAIPNSRYDICACKDGSIAIFRTKQCGQMNALWEVTFERWK